MALIAIAVLLLRRLISASGRLLVGGGPWVRWPFDGHLTQG
jgi:hypothetical protein